jgi:GNAT superfamily N-acetyltransferase
VLAPSFETSFPLENGAFHESFENLLEHRDATLLVVEEDRGRVTGYLLTFVDDSLFAHGSVDWIGEAAVKASVRRQGYGRALTVECQRRALARGAGLVALAPRRALPFYESMEYEMSGTYLRKLL